MKMKSKLKTGDILRVVFLDHSAATGQDNGFLEFEAFGRLVAETETHYVLATWCYSNADVDHNSEYYYLVKGAVKSITKLGKK